MTRFIEINLLAKAEKPTPWSRLSLNVPRLTFTLPRWARAAAIGGACGVVAILHLIPMWTAGRAARLTAQYQQELGMLADQEREIQQVTQALNELQQRAELSVAGAQSWTVFLQGLSEALSDGVWLAKLVAGESDQADPQLGPGPTVSGRHLDITGTAIAAGGEEPRVIGDFLRALQANPRFMSQVRQVELGPTERREIKAVEVMDFTIHGAFKEL